VSGTGRILYFTDKLKVSAGYEPAFQKMLGKSGIKRQQVVLTDIYGLVSNPLVKIGNEKLWRFNPEKVDELRKAFDQRVRVIKPSVIVVSCPAVIGVLVNGDQRLGTLDKCRGGVYYHDGIPVIVTYPITAIHRNVDERLTKDVYGNNNEDEESKYEPYKVPQGAWILGQDWRKVGRFFHGKQRVIPPFYYSVVRTLDDAYAARAFLDSCVAIATDVETGLYPAQITCEGFTGIDRQGRVRTFVFPYYDPRNESGCFWDSADDHAIVWSVACAIRENPAVKIGQNLKYDCAYYIKYHGGLNNYLGDLMLVWYSMYMELPKSIDFICSILLDNFQYWKDDIKGIEDKDQTGVGMETYWRYNGLDCYNTLWGWIFMQRFLLADKQLQFNYNDTFMRMLSGLRMSMRGVRVDPVRRREHSRALQAEAERNAFRFQYLVADPDFNVGSGPQKCSLLYDVFGVRERNSRGRFVDRSKPLKGGNAPSAGAIALKMVRTEHPLFRFVIDALTETMVPRDQMSKLVGRWDDDQARFIGGVFVPINRFQTSYSAAGTESTRFASKKSDFWTGGNSQNWRTKYKDWLVADPHNIFMDVDYSQSDDVFIGYESNDPTKIEVIESGVDGHALHGELFFKVPYDEIIAGKKAKDPRIVHPIKGIRQISKRVVHGTNFQMAAMTLYTTMGRDTVVAAAHILGFADADSWPQDRLVALCGSLMLAYRKKYKRLNKKEWYSEIEKQLLQFGLIKNAFGITRRFLGDPKDNGTQREATSFFGQSDTAGNMNRSMYEFDFGWMPKSFRDGPNPDYGQTPLKMDWWSHGFRIMLQVHDNFLIQLDTRHPKWKEAAHNVLHVMERPVIINGHTVRVKTEAEFGVRWGYGLKHSWDGKDNDALDRIAASCLEEQKEYL
jgi:DNA polymerase I-like protein with 3'-5' exonuclease and polymerase domains